MLVLTCEIMSIPVAQVYLKYQKLTIARITILDSSEPSHLLPFQKQWRQDFAQSAERNQSEKLAYSSAEGNSYNIIVIIIITTTNTTTTTSTSNNNNNLLLFW